MAKKKAEKIVKPKNDEIRGVSLTVTLVPREVIVELSMRKIIYRGTDLEEANRIKRQYEDSMLMGQS